MVVPKGIITVVSALISTSPGKVVLVRVKVLPGEL
jgi:hypothetical protein